MTGTPGCLPTVSPAPVTAQVMKTSQVHAGLPVPAERPRRRSRAAAEECPIRAPRSREHRPHGGERAARRGARGARVGPWAAASAPAGAARRLGGGRAGGGGGGGWGGRFGAPHPASLFSWRASSAGRAARTRSSDEDVERAGVARPAAAAQGADRVGEVGLLGRVREALGEQGLEPGAQELLGRGRRGWRPRARRRPGRRPVLVLVRGRGRPDRVVGRPVPALAPGDPGRGDLAVEPERAAARVPLLAVAADPAGVVELGDLGQAEALEELELGVVDLLGEDVDQAHGAAGGGDDRDVAAGHGGAAVGGEPAAVAVGQQAPALARGGRRLGGGLGGGAGRRARGGEAEEAQGGGEGAGAALGEAALDGAQGELAQAGLLGLGRRGLERLAVADEVAEVGGGAERGEGGRREAGLDGGEGRGLAGRQQLGGDQELARGGLGRGLRGGHGRAYGRMGSGVQ